MVDPAVIVAVIGAMQAVTVAVIGGVFARLNSNAQAREDARNAKDEERARRDACLYDLMFATASGTEVLLHQAHGDHVNGNVEEALNSIKKAKSECNHLFNEQAAKL